MLYSHTTKSVSDIDHPLVSVVCCFVGSENHGRVVLSILYHVSFDRKSRSVFAYTDCVPQVLEWGEGGREGGRGGGRQGVREAGREKEGGRKVERAVWRNEKRERKKQTDRGGRREKERVREREEGKIDGKRRFV